MTNRAPPPRALALAAIGMACGVSTVRSQPSDTCFTGWSEALPVVEREALASVRDLHVLARRHNVGDVVRVTLCSDQGRFVYHLLVRESVGRVVALTVDARHPFDPD